MGGKKEKYICPVFIIIIIIIIITIIIISTFITVSAGVLYVRQPGANHAPRASVTQVNLSVHEQIIIIITTIIIIIIIIIQTNVRQEHHIQRDIPVL